MKNRKGFTLVELMIAMTVGGVLLMAVYSTYNVQQRVFTAQDQVAEMQQNIRAALMLTAREIRMAGYDPLNMSGAGIEEFGLPAPSSLRVGRINFTLDANDTGALNDGAAVDPPERLELGFSPADDVAGDGLPDADADGDGVPDAVPFRRQVDGAGGWQSVAENIQAIEFLYLDSTDNVTTVLADIRAIRVSILARARRPDPKFTSAMTYTPASGNAWDLNGVAAGNAANDNFRRRLLITTIQCRNLGL